ncbi:lysoplasmalogenase family protein [Snuella sedimenti]|uniref:YhhN-like protein n=1 Tax=Snuella sedimenti TaxID=2798802 RepID=A0A8J7LNA8_9FLAO|nr:lysoplasmalogenase family protein [Snuella sedimenti]MBJ6367648.1 hypothetical protein [Snuella sedimenti]
MINRIFSDQKRFTLLFFVILFVDIWVKLYCPIFPYRFISKPFVILVLFAFYYVNKRGKGLKQHLWVFLGLTFFLLGDLLIIKAADIVFLGLSLLLFSLGKIFFCLKFSHKKDFNVLRLVPFSIIMFSYAVFIISIVLNGLKKFLVPALLSFFLSLLMVQFAYLRKGVFNKISYRYVFLGVITFIISESIMAVKTFRQDLPFQDFLIMMLYGTAMYFIVLGIVRERRYKISFS